MSAVRHGKGRRGFRLREDRVKRHAGWGAALAAIGIATGALPTGAQEPAADDGLAGRVESLVEQVQALQADTDKLKKFKFSGYLQARYESSQVSDDSVRAAGSPLVLTPANLDRFYIRRARLKVTYDPSERTQGVVYFDGGADRSVRLLEAYVTLSDPWTPYQSHQVTIGQFNIPFGHEIERSSSAREVPERSRVENVLFPGERDRGVKLHNRWSDRFETTFAVMNGGGVGQADYPNTDPTAAKDWMGRARVSLGTFDAAVSAYAGKGVVGLTGPDAEVDRTRLGADAQYYWELPTLGGGTVRGELFAGEETNPDSVSALTTRATSDQPVRRLKPGASGAHLDTEFLGWYLMLVQNLGDRWQVAGRFDRFDRNVAVDHDQYERWTVAAHWFYDGYTRLTLAYEIPKTDVTSGDGFADPDDNLLTFQAQYRF
jgi:phosphate-selective porin